MIRNIVCLIVSVTIATPSEVAAAERYVAANFTDTWNGAGGASRQLTDIPDVQRSAEFNIDENRDAAFGIADSYGTVNYYIADLVDSLDYEPINAFEYVRDRLALDPYAGSLRSETSVLSARGGNALDRAVLLQRLVQDMGYDARLVFGDLPDDALDTLVKRSIEPATEWDVGPLAAMGGFVPQMMQRFVDRARRDYRWLKDAVPPKSLTGAKLPDTRERLKRHVWLQVDLGDGWTDFDPSFIDAEIGSRFAEVAGYEAEMPSELRQKVRFRVVAEYLSADGVEEEVSLEYEVDADTAAVSQIYLAFRPTSIGLGSTLAEKLGQKPSFKPMLLVNDETHTGSELPPVIEAQGDSEDFLFGSGEGKQLTALYLDVETVVPGEVGTSRRRPLIDRLPVVARMGGAIDPTALAPVEKINGLPVPFTQIHQLVTSHGGSNPFQVANDVGLAVYYVGEYFGDEEIMRRMGVDQLMWPAAMLRRVPVAVSEQASVGALNDRDDMRFFVGEPRVFVFSLSANIESADDSFAIAVDLLVDSVDVVALNTARPADIADRQMRYGVMQGAFETSYLETVIAASGVPGNLNSASKLSLQKAIVYMAPGEIGSLDGVPNAMRSDLLTGNRVVTGSSEQGIATDVWWSVASNGETRAMLAPGLGGSDWWSRWRNWTNINPYSTAKPSHTHMRPWMDPEDFNEEMREFVKKHNEKMREANRKANKQYSNTRQHAARTSRAGRTPKVNRKSGGGTEYATVQEVALAVLETGVGFFGMILTATLVASFIVIFAFISIYNVSRDKNWDHHTPFDPNI
ncbi:MAG: hypothetical protein AAF417_09140 [Pseudomonadota bacterium]